MSAIITGGGRVRHDVQRLFRDQLRAHQGLRQVPHQGRLWRGLGRRRLPRAAAARARRRPARVRGSATFVADMLEVRQALASVPRMDLHRGRRLVPIEGQPPDLTRLDDGCAYRPRCRWASARCASEFPPLEEVGNGQVAACWRMREMQELRKEAS